MGNVNLVANPSFETNTTGWSATNATIGQDTAPHVVQGTGAFSLRVTAGATVAPSSANYTVTGLTVGKNYTVSFYVKIQASAANFSVVPSVAGVFTSQQPLRSGDNFVRRFIGFQATATSVVISLTTETNIPMNDIFWVDRVMVTEDGLMPYFDGSYPFTTWTGTAHASTSTNSIFTNALVGPNPTTDEVVVVNGYCLNNLAWNITTKNGRYSVPGTRGDDYTLPGVSGKVFVPNKPLDTGLFTLSMFVLGAYPDGSIPPAPAQRMALQHNLEQIFRQCFSTSYLVTLYQWHPSGAVRVSQGTMAGSSANDVSMFMGGRRAELSLAFEIMSGVWTDYLPATVAGTPSASWSNQTLSLTALRGGTANIEDSVVTVTGPITNPIVSNTATGTSVKYTGTVPSGQTWVIDSGQYTSKVNGTSILSNTTHSGHARFLVIDSGDAFNPPTVTLTGSGTSSVTNLSVTATRKHLIA